MCHEEMPLSSSNGADGGDLMTRLSAAVRRDDLDEVNRLFDANPALIRLAGPALRAACRYGTLEMVTLLLDRGVALEADLLFDAWGSEKYRLLLDRGADVGAVTHHHGASDWTALHSAVRRQPADVVRWLLELGCDWNARAGDGDYECEGFTPLQTAAKFAFDEKREKVDLLLAAGAEMDLFTAAYLGDAARIEAILTGDPAQVRAGDAYGATALHAAAFSAMPEAFSLLIRRGADLNARDRRGRTPILVAATTGDEEFMRHVLRFRPALDAFANAALGKTIGLLIDLQTVPNAASAQDESGWTPLHWASRTNRLPSILALLEHGAKIEARDRLGRTPLWLACLNGHREAAETLLDYKADIHAKEDSGFGLLDYDLGELGEVLRRRGLKD
jgi:ankyrin repeat protein